jgi:hypothetical protein
MMSRMNAANDLHVFSPVTGDPKALTHARRGVFFDRLYAVYIFMLVILPTGSIFGINVKIICFLLLMPLALGRVNRSLLFNPRMAAFLFGAILFTPWMILGVVNDFPFRFVFSQFKDLSVVLLTCWLSLLYCQHSDARRIRLARLIVYAVLAVSILKCLIILYSIVKGVSVSVVVMSLEDIFSIQLMTFGTENLLGRIVFESDNLIPICFFAIIVHRRALEFKAAWAAIAVALMAFSAIYSFSRYLWVFCLAGLILSLIFAPKGRFKNGMTLAVVATTLAFLPFFTNLVNERFSNEVSGESTDVRDVSVSALKTSILTAPVFGRGLGSYVRDATRSTYDVAPYAYEVEWYSLTSQLGIVGLLLWCSFGAIYFCNLMKRWKRWKQTLPLALLLMLWLFGAFYNPMLTSSFSAVAYSLIMVFADMQEDFDTFRTGYPRTRLKTPALRLNT